MKQEYFALLDMERVVSLGEHESFCDADEAASGLAGCMWLIPRAELEAFVQNARTALDATR